MVVDRFKDQMSTWFGTENFIDEDFTKSISGTKGPIHDINWSI